VRLQLNGKKSIRNALAVAACTVLSQAPSPAGADEFPWKADLTTLYYTEKDRVTVSESILSLRRDIGNDEAFGLKVTYDAISGASANGAIFGTDSGGVQTVTSPSGVARTISVGAGARVDPLTEFEDNRIAAQLALERALWRTFTARVEGTLSTEQDYDSFGAGGLFLWDLNQRLTTLTGGLSFNNDTVKPSTGTPVAFSSVSSAERLENGEKRAIDSLFGVSQIVSRRTLTQFNYTRGRTDGYLTDPYKILTVVDSAGEPVDYLYEKRPTDRNRNALFWRVAHHLTEDVIHFAYRYAWDDWGIRSHTADLKYRYELVRGHYLQAHLRYYTQTAADFYRFSLAEGAPLPQHASADYRLGNLITQTAGVKYGLPLGKRVEFGIRAEYMQQRDADDRFPKVDIVLVQATLSYSDIVDYALWSRPPP
jgi:hypothetical protein